MNNNAFNKYWKEKGREIALGHCKLIKSDLIAIYSNLRLDLFRPSYLPGANTISGSASDRKNVIFALAWQLWKIPPDIWLHVERKWLTDARKESGSIETGGKDSLDDVVSAELLIRIIATAKLVHEYSTDNVLVDEAITALNLTLAEVCTKGRSRMEFTNGISVYAVLKNFGIMIGTGGGKYLPYPEKSLPELLMLLDQNMITPGVYVPD